MYVTPDNKKPVIITGTGKYQTRAGDIVTIDTVHDHSDDYSVTRYNCKGTMAVKRKGKKVKHVWNIWHESGDFGGDIGEHPEDIVKKLDQST
jgi:hypothetical protein